MRDKLKEKYNQIKLANKKLYLITNSNQFDSDDDFLDAVASAIEGGADILQLGERHLPARKILELGRTIKQLCLQYDATFIVNDRVDIAALLEADGVYLTQDDLDVASAREILGHNAIVGVSTQTPEQALKAVEDGADYIVVGPVFETSTNQCRVPVGLEYVKWVSENISIPAFAAGGIDPENFQQVLLAGLNRLAVSSAIMNADSPKDAAEEILKYCAILSIKISDV